MDSARAFTVLSLSRWASVFAVLILRGAYLPLASISLISCILVRYRAFAASMALGALSRVLRAAFSFAWSIIGFPPYWFEMISSH